MNAELKAKWVAALRSGRYEQVQGVLREEGGYCCLGVLCDVHGGGRWDHREAFQFKGSCEVGKLPESLAAEAEINSFDETILACMNDEEGKSFSEIADYIEANL